MRMHTTLKNDILRNEQPSGSAVNSFFDQGNFEAVKMFSGLEAAHSNKHQFRAFLELSLFEKWSKQRI